MTATRHLSPFAVDDGDYLGRSLPRPPITSAQGATTRGGRPVYLDLAELASWQAAQDAARAGYYRDSPAGRALVARAVVR